MKSVLNNFEDFLEAYSLSKICKIVLEYTLKCSQLISSSDSKKILLTTRNVRLDSGCYATKYYFQLFKWVAISIAFQGSLVHKGSLGTLLSGYGILVALEKHRTNPWVL
jgi:hypothetical protein